MRELHVEPMPEHLSFWPVKGPSDIVYDHGNPLLPVMHLVAHAKPSPNPEADTIGRTWAGITSNQLTLLTVRIAVSKTTPDGPRMLSMPVERHEISPGLYWYNAPVITLLSGTPKLVRVRFQGQEATYYHTLDGDVAVIDSREAKDILARLTNDRTRLEVPSAQ